MNFPTTQWMLVRQGREALAELFQRYHPALKAHLMKARQMQASDADDLIQGFVTTQMVEKDLIARADETKGKFRTFLLTALNRYAMNRRRDQQTESNSPKQGLLISLDSQIDPPGCAASPAADAFDTEWARAILNETIRRMRLHCEHKGRMEIWGVFEARLLKPLLNHEPPSDYQELCDHFGLRSPTQTAYLLATAKRVYLRMLRSVISEYVMDEEQIEEEINDLINILARPRAKG